MRDQPMLVTVVSEPALGLFWLPLRALAENRLDAGWATIGVFAGPVLVMLPFAIWRLSRDQAIGLGQSVTGLLTGGALA